MGYYLVTYDVQSDKARRGLTKLLENLGTRLQKSVFLLKSAGNAIQERNARFF